MDKPYQPADTDFLYEIFPEAFDGKFETSPDTVWFAHLVKGEIIGIVNAEERGPGVWYFAGGIVKPEFRRQGIWRKLHQDRTEYCIEHGAKILFAVSAPGNRKAFNAEGWTQLTRYPYHENFDEVVYFRCIDD